MSPKMHQLQNQLIAAARESPLLIFEATSRKDGTSFREISNRRRYKNLTTMLATNYDFKILADELRVTETVVNWAIAEARLHDEPEDTTNKQAFKETTNNVLRENGVAENN
ncbi:hypothetical protein [Loigolactobacillus coryniformis]|jgi:hypothetical protein|uniref:Uncharacterized protein n=1 Tax=Loigolactobacillus coryniformis subsp. torquens DSM 20004 = KCTC 3535 TaxID=1423822 RepID=A0A2D1KKK3_9LACO|nr:hypothetical protein [Loigolactobacillus coryniformis]ATO42649.1 hypothetical protein LC20004_01360 [Loigolactobacillus coryniformis subsp. torquens DSM 20004 = KCTC 3535]KRK85553.1 hypothetical protein FC16_GL000965 [Loigolactobacillus coryniformis subsp. torquens DSM 20004 = KCTC 3535]MCL5457120.1 hypothetical protein [Loigolactobacillus coryniformis]